MFSHGLLPSKRPPPLPKAKNRSLPVFQRGFSWDTASDTLGGYHGTHEPWALIEMLSASNLRVSETIIV